MYRLWIDDEVGIVYVNVVLLKGLDDIWEKLVKEISWINLFLVLNF